MPMLAAALSGMWKYLAVLVGALIAKAEAKKAGRTEADAEGLRRETDAAKRVADAGASARPGADALTERLRRNDW